MSCNRRSREGTPILAVDSFHKQQWEKSRGAGPGAGGTKETARTEVKKKKIGKMWQGSVPETGRDRRTLALNSCAKKGGSLRLKQGKKMGGSGAPTGKSVKV